MKLLRQGGSVERLCLFARAPELGKVKTRLAAGLGPTAALAAYQRLVHHTVQRLQGVTVDRRELWFAGTPEHPQLQRWAQDLQASLLPQLGSGLGERMYLAAYQSDLVPALTAASSQSVVIVGSDCPSIDAALVAAAFAALKSGSDVVIAPAEDGGYGLIGLHWQQRPAFAHSPFFAVDWSTNAVYAQTVARCAAHGLTLTTLPQIWDVDTEADWQRYLAHYGAGEPG